MPSKILILFTFLFSFLICEAEGTQEGTRLESKEVQPEIKESGGKDEKTDEKEEKKLGIIAFPIVFYSSDTNFGFGASAVLHKEHFKDEYVSKSNSLAMVFFYTLRNQMLSANVGNLYWYNIDRCNIRTTRHE